MLSDEVKAQCELNRRSMRSFGDGYLTIRKAGWCVECKCRLRECECPSRERSELDFEDPAQLWQRLGQDDP